MGTISWRDRWGPIRGAARSGAVVMLACATFCGCHRPNEPAGQQVALRTEIIEPDEQWRFRVVGDMRDFEKLTEPLCGEFGLIEIADAGAWRRLREALRLQGVPDRFDFQRGKLIGLIAAVGQPLSSEWPIAIERLRMNHGVGLLVAHVTEGLFHPVRTAPYGVLAYVRGLDRLSTVRINQRVFCLAP